MAFSFGAKPAGTPAFGTPGTPALPSFGFGSSPANTSSAFSFGATSASSTPAFGGGSSSFQFGAASTPSLFGGGAASPPSSLFGGGAASGPSLFGAASTPSLFGASASGAPSLFGAPGPASVFGAAPGGSILGVTQLMPAAPVTALLTKENRPVVHSTAWDDISPAGQAGLLKLEQVIVQLREESKALGADERLQDASSSRQTLPAAVTTLRQDIAALEGRLAADDAASSELREHVVAALRATEATLRAFQRSHLWRESGKLPPGQPPTQQLLEQLNRGVILPNPYLATTLAAHKDQVVALKKALAALQSVLPQGSGMSAGRPAPAGAFDDSVRGSQELLLAVAGRVWALADAAAAHKAAYLAAKRAAGDYSDPFETVQSRNMMASGAKSLAGDGNRCSGEALR